MKKNNQKEINKEEIMENNNSDQKSSANTNADIDRNINDAGEDNYIDEDNYVDDKEEIIDTDEDGNELSGKNQLKRLREQIKKLESEKQEYLNSWQRALADYKNREKQINDEKKSWADYAIKKFVEDIMIVVDTYDAARSNKEAWESVDHNWRAGIEYIFQTFENKLKDKGFEKININLGDTFDPNIHEAIGTIETDDSNMINKVAQIVIGGYNFKGVMFRPVKVKVYKNI